MIPKLNGKLVSAIGSSAGVSRDDLAARANLSRDVLRCWEVSSESIVPAQYQMPCSALDVLEAEGVRFCDGGVHLERSTVLPSDTPTMGYGGMRLTGGQF